MEIPPPALILIENVESVQETDVFKILFKVLCMVYGPEKPETIKTIKTLSSAKNAKLFKVLAGYVKKPRRQQVEVNINKIALHSKPNSVVVVPGKVLASGEIKHKVDVVALSFTETAKKKIKASGGDVHDFEWLVKRGAKDVVLLK